jgi:predicted esterase
MTTSRPDVFLSYSREDQATARRFAEALKREGFLVWWDQALSTGEAYDAVTEAALDGARSVVVLWSKKSVTSRWVRAEATTADRNGVLMPVMMEDCRRPVMFELTQTADLSAWNGDANAPEWRSFIADLRRLVLRGQPPEAGHVLDKAARQAMAASTASAPASSPVPARGSAPTRLLLTAGLAIVLSGLLAAGLLGWQRNQRVKQARAEVLEIAALVDKGDFPEAFSRAREIRRYVPDDPMLKSLTPLFTAVYSVGSMPEGADVHVRGYESADEEWVHLGRTPLSNIEQPRRPLRWRFEKPGHRTVERATSALGDKEARGTFLETVTGVLDVKLWPDAELPGDMVHIPGGKTIAPYGTLPPAEVPAFFIDRHEVTNAQYKEFVDAGGYQRRQYWDGLGLKDEDVARFVDGTGRPGPSNWELGSYPQGRGEYPVTGISWYEASAYARFRNRVLPSAFHWRQAAMREDEIGTSFAATVVPLSNFGTEGPVEVGRSRGMGPYGASDLYGNVREWVSNPRPGGGWVIGGSWEDPIYSYMDLVPVSRMERSRLNGFRLMKPSPEAADLPALHGEIEMTPTRQDILTARPVSDAIYAGYQRQFLYRPGPLNASSPETMATNEDWIKQRVTLDTGYEGKRMEVILFLPRRGQPPFQPVILFSGMHMFYFPAKVESIEPGFASLPLDYIVKSGRVLVQPIFEGTYERFRAPIDFNDEIRLAREYAAWRMDLGRTIDYLETRVDIDARNLGYIGLSFGSSAALPLVATEPRLKAAVLVSGGIPPQIYPPALDPLNYASRITMPVLMINGRYDAGFTVEGNQKPLYRLLGTPPADKRHVILEYGHGSPPRGETLSETLAWYDKYLGPVRN